MQSSSCQSTVLSIATKTVRHVVILVFIALIFLQLNACSNSISMVSTRSETVKPKTSIAHHSNSKATLHNKQSTQPIIVQYEASQKNSILIHSSISERYWHDAPQKSAKKVNIIRQSKPNYSDSFWKELIASFQLKQTNKPNYHVQKYVTYYLNNAKLYNQAFANAAPYLRYIFNKIKKHNLPGEMLLLPIIESLYKPNAVSPAGAAGIWQFTKSTGDFYGLKRTYWYDGRFDVINSTESAINLLSDMYVQLNSWPLALAAYNFGIGNVKKRIRFNKKRQLKTDYWSLKLPRETREYVPKLLAIAYLLKNIADYPQLKLPVADKLIEFVEIELDHAQE